jgi:hypothetical protein
MIAPVVIIGAALVAAVLQSSSIDQISPRETPVAKTGAQRTIVSNDDGADAAQSAQIKQLDDSPSGNPDATQLTTERAGGDVVQLGRADRNTQSSPDLSSRSQGFETRVVKLEGTDRCSAELPSARDREFCQRVIENRSAEYASRREPGLTPEQALLAQRNLNLIDGGTDAAIKRLANGRNSGDDNDDQSVASVVLNGSDAADSSGQELPADSKLSAQTQALVDAIVRNVTAAPRP